MRKPAWILSFALLGSLALSAWLWLALRDAQALNRELAARLSAPNAPAEPLPVAAAPSSTAAEVSVPGPLPYAASIAASDAPKVSAKVRQQQWANYQQRLLSDSRYREAWKQQWRINHAPRRENLVRVVGLAPEQADAVLELQIDQELQNFETAGREVSDPEEERQQQARQQAIEAELEARLQKLLGPEKYERLDRYMQSRQSRMQVDRFRGELSATDMLRDDQVEPLISAMHGEQERFLQELTQYQETLDWNSDPTTSLRQYEQKKSELSKEAHARMHSGASAILTNAQLDELDAMLQRDRDRDASRQQMIRMRSTIEAGGQAAGAQ